MTDDELKLRLEACESMVGLEQILFEHLDGKASKSDCKLLFSRLIAGIVEEKREAHKSFLYALMTIRADWLKAIRV